MNKIKSEMHIPDVEALRRQALKLNEQGKFNEAKKLYDNALKMDPTNSSTMRVASWNLRDMGEYNESLKLLEKCLILYEEKHHIWWDMARIYEKMAIEVCEKKGFKNFPHLTFLERWAEIKPYYEKAIECMEAAAEALPTSWGILHDLERFHVIIGDYVKAAEYQEKVKKCYITNQRNVKDE